MVEQAMIALQEVSITKALWVFFVTAVLDSLWAIYTHRITQRRAYAASSLSAVIIIASGLIAIEYVSNNWYLIPTGLGAFVGTYITIKFDNRKRTEVEEAAHKLTRV